MQRRPAFLQAQEAVRMHLFRGPHGQHESVRAICVSWLLLLRLAAGGGEVDEGRSESGVPESF